MQNRHATPGSDLTMTLLYKLEAKIRSAVPARLGTAVWQDLYLWPLVNLPQSGDDDATIRWATSNDLGLLVRRDGEATANYRLGRGNQAAVFIGDAGIDGIAWFAREEYDDMDTRLEFALQANQAWLFGAWVSRNLRGQGIYRRLTSFAANALREQAAIDQIFLAIDRSNRTSRAVHGRLGASLVGSIRGGRLFGRSRYLVKIGDQIHRCSSGTTMRVNFVGNSQ